MDDIAHRWRQPHQFEGTDHYGIRLINLTTTQRDALTGSGAARAGSVIWNTTTSAIEYYDGSGWSGVPITVTQVELGYIDGATPGTVVASKAVVVDSSKDISGFRHVTQIGPAGTGTASASVLGLHTAEPTVVSGDHLGRIEFKAPSETGADAILVAASIWAVANATFDATHNGTDLVFATGDSEAAAEKMRLSSTGALLLSGAATATGGIAAAGGFSHSPRHVHTGGVPAQVSTEGTNLDAVVTELYVAEVFIPANCSVTGVAVLWGTNTNGNAKVMLFNSAGARVALSASTDVSGFTGASYGTNIAFSAPYAAVGPATYYVGVICDDNTNDIRTHILGAFGAGKIESLVYATEAGYATITVPTTFTTGLGPIASLY